ncbi:fimbrial protein [Klebsiella spallanzanii]|uniref:fimbrial protein n=1 Tax=Klebsiella spallanzanii TaxID=2587528 RepID=UPI00115B267F|nr:fimbrial protein [Klebsiella spallanzanii]VUS96406.1 Fimbria adhesin protein [Klebsiella spallanzanii]
MRFRNALLVALIVSLPVYAINISEDVYWYDGDSAGQKAATCIYHTPDKRPFADVVTLVTDNAQTDGTVLWSWDYATFLPDYTLSCVGSGISNSTNRLRDTARGNPSDWQLRLTAQGGNDLMPTTNSGVGIRWYFHTSQGEQVKTQAQLPAVASLEVSPNGAGRYIFNPGKVATLSAKAELVKTGDTIYGTAISPQPAQSQLWLEAGTTKSSLEDLGHGGITPVAPACRLSTKEYQVEMGRWVTQSSGQLPARGAETPFELQLECTGQVAHLRLRFEDSGTRTSANQNVTLYRASGGESVEGLEVEMLFNGNRINIGDTETLDTGTRGRNIRNHSTPIYDAAVPVTLTARYLQYAAITSGSSTYTGNISGKVNIWMSYD